MKREIYIVSASIVDANGTFNFLSGYPKIFDSKNYGGDTDRARMRALSDYHEVVGGMCKVDTRQIQTVRLSDVNGFVLETRTTGQFVMAHPVQEPESGGDEA